jgi:hypothetical protein
LGLAGKKEVASDRRAEIARVLNAHVERATMIRAAHCCASLISIEDLEFASVQSYRPREFIGKPLGRWRVAKIEDRNPDGSRSGLRGADRRQAEPQYHAKRKLKSGPND